MLWAFELSWDMTAHVTESCRRMPKWSFPGGTQWWTTGFGYTVYRQNLGQSQNHINLWSWCHPCTAQFYGAPQFSRGWSQQNFISRWFEGTPRDCPRCIAKGTGFESSTYLAWKQTGNFHSTGNVEWELISTMVFFPFQTAARICLRQYSSGGASCAWASATGVLKGQFSHSQTVKFGGFHSHGDTP